MAQALSQRHLQHRRGLTILVNLLSKVRFMGSLKAEQRRAPDTCLGVALGIWLRRKHIHTQ